MSNTIQPRPSGAGGLVVRSDEETRASAKRYSAARLSDNTMRAYRGDWRVYERWCAAHGVAASPIEASRIVLYLTDLADGVVNAGRAHQWGVPRRASTVARHLAAIGTVARLTGQKSAREACRHDEVRDFMDGIRNTKGVRPNAKRAAVLNIVRAMILAVTSEDPIDVRTRALILLGFWTACRRSEIASLLSADVIVERDSVRVLIRRAKGDQTGKGAWVKAPAAGDAVVCPVAAMVAWRATRTALGIDTAREFVSFADGNQYGEITGGVIATSVKNAVRAAGFDATEFAGHSLRSGFVTTAGHSNVAVAKIVQKTRHKRLDTLAAYLHDIEGIENDAGFGLA